MILKSFVSLVCLLSLLNSEIKWLLSPNMNSFGGKKEVFASNILKSLFLIF